MERIRIFIAKVEEVCRKIGKKLDMIGYSIDVWFLRIYNTITIICLAYLIAAFFLPIGFYSEYERQTYMSLVYMLITVAVFYGIGRLAWWLISFVAVRINIFRIIAPYDDETMPPLDPEIENPVHFYDRNKPLTQNEIMNSHGLGSILLAYTDKPLGAVITINKEMLINNKVMIREGIFQRDDEFRGQQYVAGYKDNPNMRKYGEYYLWHRTHLIPFRYGLSEIGKIMFTGTGHLNSGDRPQVGFFRDKTSNIGREFINESLNHDYKNLSYFSHPKTAEQRDTHFSLDDYERLADYVINCNPDYLFNYSVVCKYSGQSKIPVSVRVRMVNTETNDVMFAATLSNTL